MLNRQQSHNQTYEEEIEKCGKAVNLATVCNTIGIMLWKRKTTQEKNSDGMCNNELIDVKVSRKPNFEFLRLGYTKHGLEFDSYRYVRASRIHAIPSIDEYCYPTFETVQMMLEGKVYNPTDEFKPSQSLVTLINSSLVPMSKEMSEMLGTLEEINSQDIDEREVLSALITDEIEELFTNLAQRYIYSGQEPQISENGSFTHDIYMDLIDRLSLHAKHADTVLQLLHDELVYFVTRCELERPWGKIICEKSDLKLVLN